MQVCMNSVSVCVINEIYSTNKFTHYKYSAAEAVVVESSNVIRMFRVDA